MINDQPHIVAFSDPDQSLWLLFFYHHGRSGGGDCMLSNKLAIDRKGTKKNSPFSKSDLWDRSLQTRCRVLLGNGGNSRKYSKCM